VARTASGVTLTRTSGAWDRGVGADVQGADYDHDSTHHLLSVTVLDGSTSFRDPGPARAARVGAMIARGP